MLRSFDPEVVATLYEVASHDEHPVFWDIGANKCACSYEISQLLPTAKIVAIEPQPALRDANVFNLMNTCPGRFEYVQAGIGERCEQKNSLFRAQTAEGPPCTSRK